MSGHRAQRVADLIHRELAQLIQEEVRDPRVGFVTITEVKVTGDLRHARIYVTSLEQQQEEDRSGTVDALVRATPFLRRALAHRAGLKFTPDLKFFYDEVIESGRRVEDLLRDVLPVYGPVEPDESEDSEDS